MVSLQSIGPEVPFPLNQILQSFYDAIMELQAGQLVTMDYASLPPADENRGCMVHVSDRNCIAISTLVSGAYEWRRANGAAV